MGTNIIPNRGGIDDFAGVQSDGTTCFVLLFINIFELQIHSLKGAVCKIEAVFANISCSLMFIRSSQMKKRKNNPLIPVSQSLAIGYWILDIGYWILVVGLFCVHA
ncbi:MAG: hypothetical protein JW798_16900 [Prolixibacteraceae bacterium]|nr:hypothetical protein [Prolixibacteraceae bacterium]